MNTQETYEESIWRGVSAPLIVTWMIASFLPIFGLMGASKSGVHMFVEGIFLATGFVGIFGLWAFAMFAGGEGTHDPAKAFVRNKEKILRGIAVIWLMAYAGFHFLINLPAR